MWANSGPRLNLYLALANTYSVFHTLTIPGKTDNLCKTTARIFFEKLKATGICEVGILPTKQCWRDRTKHLRSNYFLTS